jgi:hypothetical protein
MRITMTLQAVTRAMRSAPESLVWLILIALSAAWATRTGTLPGQSLTLGAWLEGIAWACLYAGLGLTYYAAGRPDDKSLARVLRRIGLCLLLALLSTQLCKLLSATLVAPATWGNLFYLKWLVPFASVALWCAVLLPSETRALVRAARASPALAPLPHLALLLASAAILVSCGDLVFEGRGGSSVEATLKSELITSRAWAANILILFSAFAFVFAVTSRLSAALLFVSPIYLALGLATVLKIRYMHSAVQPLDLVRIREFLPFFRSFFGTGAVAATVGGFGVWIGALVAIGRTAPCPVSLLRRWSIGLLSVTGLLAFPVAYFLADSRPSVNELLIRFGGRGREFREFREMARANGFLMLFLSELPGAFVSEPDAYSSAEVASAQGRYCGAGGMAGGSRGGVSLVLYMIESFMDPDDLGLHYTSDPIPNVRALRRANIGGYGIVPEDFGGSANSEFEALTGMATSFLPEGSVAYRLYLRHPVPSLPRALGALGYETTAVQADPKYFYGRETVYRLLGFDRVAWLREAAGVERAPRGWWPSDKAVVQAVIQASQGARPFFVFAFPSSTHSPYDRGTYKDSSLGVVDPPSPEAGGEVKEYINTLRVADEAVGTLVEYFRGRPDSTIIAVLGDHLPPLTESSLGGLSSRISGLSEPEQARMRRRVPLLVWANFPLPREQKELSTNALPSYLLEKMKIAPAGFLAVSDEVRRRVPILARYAHGADGSIWNRDSLPDEERRLVEDYWLLEYDLLLGKRYVLRDSAWMEGRCGD